MVVDQISGRRDDRMYLKWLFTSSPFDAAVVVDNNANLFKQPIEMNQDESSVALVNERWRKHGGSYSYRDDVVALDSVQRHKQMTIIILISLFQPSQDAVWRWAPRVNLFQSVNPSVGCVWRQKDVRSDACVFCVCVCVCVLPLNAKETWSNWWYELVGSAGRGDDGSVAAKRARVHGSMKANFAKQTWFRLKRETLCTDSIRWSG